ncbi:hypothetical protein N7532_006587 [Penicillium argentinense]|uniref:Conidiation-specific protein Con-10 n=1 Tax=Penicillium argentinense TaxID=1131581 RepID=A0A9W9KBF6_9EURO|nr:uncharacterized protein N7532_006587 [Penicillium argentinense]KAJ5099586.1 hypothetical protein N7532_006587 [Penicillium argentinense]
MLRILSRLQPSSRSKRIVNGDRCDIATAAPGPHPNSGNFANQPREVLSEIGHRGGKQGGKARGVGGFHNMDPEKKRSIASKGGRAGRKAALQLEEAVEESKRRSRAAVIPPTFEEWQT